jgi:hypothetical protein
VDRDSIELRWRAITEAPELQRCTIFEILDNVAKSDWCSAANLQIVVSAAAPSAGWSGWGQERSFAPPQILVGHRAVNRCSGLVIGSLPDCVRSHAPR